MADFGNNYYRLSQIQEVWERLQDDLRTVLDNSFDDDEIMQMTISDDKMQRIVAYDPLIQATSNKNFRKLVGNLLKCMKNKATPNASESGGNLSMGPQTRMEFLGRHWCGAFVAQALYHDYSHYNGNSLEEIYQNIIKSKHLDYSENNVPNAKEESDRNYLCTSMTLNIESFYDKFVNQNREFTKECVDPLTGIVKEHESLKEGLFDKGLESKHERRKQDFTRWLNENQLDFSIDEETELVNGNKKKLLRLGNLILGESSGGKEVVVEALEHITEIQDYLLQCKVKNEIIPLAPLTSKSNEAYEKPSEKIKVLKPVLAKFTKIENKESNPEDISKNERSVRYDFSEEEDTYEGEGNYEEEEEEDDEDPYGMFGSQSAVNRISNNNSVHASFFNPFMSKMYDFQGENSKYGPSETGSKKSRIINLLHKSVDEYKKSRKMWSTQIQKYAYYMALLNGEYNGQVFEWPEFESRLVEGMHSKEVLNNKVKGLTFDSYHISPGCVLTICGNGTEDLGAGIGQDVKHAEQHAASEILTVLRSAEAK